MAYADELANTAFKGNVVIRIGGAGDYYAKHQPDSGLTVAAANRIVKSLKVNPQSVEVEEARTTFATHTVELVDVANIVTALLNNDSTNLVGKKLEVWVGRITGSFAWGDYLKLVDTYITNWKFSKEVFSFTASDLALAFQKGIFQTFALLNADTSAGAGSLVASTDLTDFPASGRLWLGDEIVTYTSKTSTTFTLSGTTANAHSQGDEMHLIVQAASTNPVDMFLQVMQSTGGGTYDTLSEGLGFTDAQMDITGIESIRDNNFSGESWTFELYQMESALKWLEDNILKPCSLRLIQTADSKIGLTLLDQVVFGASTKTLSTANTIGNPTYTVNGTKVRNVVTIKYGWDDEAQEFTRTYTLTDAESITNFGEKKPYVVEAKYIPATGAGATIATDRATRWLARLATPVPELELEAFASVSLAEVGERVLVEADLPTPLGTRDFAQELEVLSRSIDHDKGTVRFRLAWTTYSGIREAYFSPTDTATASAGAGRVRIPTGTAEGRWKLGWAVRFYDSVGSDIGTFFIIEIGNSGGTDYLLLGDTPTSTSPAASVSTPAIGSYIRFPDYDDSGLTTEQKRYGFFSNTSGADYADGTAPYKFTF